MLYPDPRYFDYAASCPPYQAALDSVSEVSCQFFANAGSRHDAGKSARRKLLELKKQFCDLLNFQDGRLLLCASGTEANNLIIEGHIARYPNTRILIAEDAHDCIWYARNKYPAITDVLPVTSHGTLDMEIFRKRLKNGISLVCINHAANETGSIHNVEEIGDLCSLHGIKLLIDGVQALGHIPVDLSQINCDYYSFSAHKFGGPRGVGGVLIRNDEFDGVIKGGNQEWGLRAGTENLPGLAGSVEAIEISIKNLEHEKKRLRVLSSTLVDRIQSELGHLLVNSSDNGLPGLLSISFPGLKSREIVTALSLKGFSISSGSACHESREEPSRIMLALGRSEKEAEGTVRISMGYGTTRDAVNNLATELISMISK